VTSLAARSGSPHDTTQVRKPVMARRALETVERAPPRAMLSATSRAVL
jgi:hypothetical protein